jgi:MFS family permease
MYCAKDMVVGLIGALFLVGIVIGCSTLTRLGDVYGRKPIYMLGICLHIGCMIGTLTTTS